MVEMVVIDRPAGGARPQRAAPVLEAIEGGNVLFLPAGAFRLTNSEQRFLEPGIVRQPRRHSGRARIIYLPAADRLLKTTLDGAARDDLQAMMVRFSGWARQLVLDLLPSYEAGITQGPASFRPCPRTGPQRLHVDSFFFFPTGGRRVLRVLTNIDPGGRPRTWQFGEEAFEPFAGRLLPRTRRAVPGSGWLLERLGVTHGRRTPYDHVMRQLRNMTKVDLDYQRNAARKVIDFPAGSSWVVFTDGVLHGALAGQFAMEQTFLLEVDAMNAPEHSPLRILEKLQGRRLA